MKVMLMMPLSVKLVSDRTTATTLAAFLRLLPLIRLLHSLLRLLLILLRLLRLLLVLLRLLLVLLRLLLVLLHLLLLLVLRSVRQHQ